MNETLRFVLMLVLGGGALSLAGGAVVLRNAEPRRLRRGLARVLGAEPEALVIAKSRGRGAAFNFHTGHLAVAWDAGAWCLVYRIDELVGAELIVDGQVLARAYRGEARRALEFFGDADKLVRLRLIFDDAAHPDFDLDLWVAGDAGRSNDAIQEASRWIARAEALLRRAPPAAAPAAVRPVATPAAVAPIAPTTMAVAPLVEDAPPWDDDEDAEEALFDDDPPPLPPRRG